jgi:hypothetical protein
MDSTTTSPTRHTATGAGSARVASYALLACLVVIASTGLPGDEPSIADPAQPAVCCTADVPAVNPWDGARPVVGSAPDGNRRYPGSEPDRVADHLGGIAARLHTVDGTPIVGDVFLLMGSSGSTANARLYDRTPYTHDRGVHPETIASNLIAAQTVRTITGSDVELLELTGAPAGGPSGGITYAIAYLNVISDGAFTGDLRVAATGRLGPEGHINSIDYIEAKIAAAHLADAAVLFTPTVPTSDARDAYGARFVGELVRDPSAGAVLNDPRRLGMFRSWGASRPDGMDVVDARHLIDVAAYLCGTGSTYACQISELLDQQAQQRSDQLQDEANSESERLLAASR